MTIKEMAANAASHKGQSSGNYKDSRARLVEELYIVSGYKHETNKAFLLNDIMNQIADKLIDFEIALRGK